VKDFWNQRYAEEGLAYGDKPNEYLTSAISQLTPGSKVLVVGDGEGRNGIWLAKQGFNVFSIDYSPVAVDKIKALAADQKVPIQVECHDLTEYEWPENFFDAVVAIYLHFPSDVRAKMHVAMLSALKPAGSIIIEAFNKDQLDYPSGGPPVEDMLFSAEILQNDFSPANIIECYESVVELNEGKYHVGKGAVVRLIAEKV